MLYEEKGNVCQIGNCDWAPSNNLQECAQCITCGKKSFDEEFVRKVYNESTS